MKTFILITAILISQIACQKKELDTDATKTAKTGVKAVNKQGKSLHAGFTALLSKHVKKGMLSYKGIQKDEALLDAYLKELENTDTSKLTANQGLAFWINAYNAFTIKLILSKYPEIDGIKDIPKRWDLDQWNAGGKNYSLNHIEHKILRVKYDDPRIHFAIVCASISCPSIANRAYEADTVDAQLTQGAKAFFANSEKGFTSTTGKTFTGKAKYTISISKILKWFSEDFERNGSKIDFILPFLPEKEQAFVKKHKDDLSIDYLTYNWKLNDAKD
ncbi:MAG: DUF547 domain-containing protein [Lentisphaeria bacterium]|nr:DUF547 domain-containing protein [Lentisphaeria bacterium]NQZ70142.1 DUF547 domain-containing protein [Lentisphaeria bacterium]